MSLFSIDIMTVDQAYGKYLVLPTLNTLQVWFLLHSKFFYSSNCVWLCEPFSDSSVIFFFFVFQTLSL